MPTQRFIDDPTLVEAVRVRGDAAGLRATPDVRPAAPRNIVVERFIVAAPGSRSTTHRFLKTVIELAVIASVGSTLVAITSTLAAVNALLTVGFIGIAAGRCAAAAGNRRSAFFGRRPANDNPIGFVLPPLLLRC